MGPGELDVLLAVLRRHGVTRYKTDCEAFEVELGAPPAVAASAPPERIVQTPEDRMAALEAELAPVIGGSP